MVRNCTRRRGGAVRYSGIRMTTQKEEHACLGRRHADRLQASSDITFQPQQQFEQGGAGPLLALVSGTVHGGVSRP